MARHSTLSLLIPLVVAVALLWGGWLWLKGFTRHGESVVVPELKGFSLAEAKDALEGKGLHLEIIDSVHTDEAPKGTVVDQDPEQGSDVKPERKVYVVMNAVQPKMLNMPALVDLSKRQAISVLEILGLKVDELRYKPDACVDCVLEQLYQGEPIAPEERIRKGGSITLVLGSGQSGERVPVPDLKGWTYAEVGMILNMASLNLGVVVECKGCNTKEDSTLAKVYRQSPTSAGNNHIGLGGLIDIWLNADTTNLRPDKALRDSLDRYQQNSNADIP